MQAPSVESLAYRRQNGAISWKWRWKKTLVQSDGYCMLAREQLGCSPGSHLAAWLDAVVFARQRE